MAKHFKLTNETKVNIFGVTLFRIECTIDCKWAKVGDKGGWVEKEDNIKGNAWVYGNAEVSGNARVYGNADYCCFQSFGSRYGTTTVFREKDNGLCVRCGCFNGSLSDFEKAVKRTHGDNEFGKIYKAIIEVIKLRFNVKE